jgi:hypothetical protein
MSFPVFLIIVLVSTLIVMGLAEVFLAIFDN